MEQKIKDILMDLRIPGNILRIIEEAIEEKRIELIPDETYGLLFKYSNDIAYEFYCDDFFENSDFVSPVSFMDICYSRNLRNPLNVTERLAGRFLSLIKRDEYEVDDDTDTKCLICYLCSKLNDKEYKKYKTIDNIDKEVPIEVFMSIFNNQKETVAVVFNDSETRIAGYLANIDIQTTMMGVSFYATIDFLARNVKGVFRSSKREIQIYPKSYMVKTLEDLGIEELTNEELEVLHQRGKKYLRITEKPHYCKYHGVAFTQGWRGDNRISVNSRVMLDINAMTYLNPEIDLHWYYGGAAFAEDGTETPDPEMLWALSPVVYGFSFGNKEWCRMLVDNIEEIVFSDTAFNDLIIPQGNKDLFIACMTNPMPSLDDIEDKGAGKIFLLYGPPGVGKTMTAEATAEHLRKPLYFVSVGELGTDPKQLEYSLERVMSIATSWDAIILLDEVDVFAVNREGASIERNAMTAIFLRTLERYSGIMFMTTNLLNNLDPAFVSRATAVIGYKDLEIEERKSIWLKVIEKAADLKEITIANDVYEMIPMLSSEHNINGRLIKNTVRLAYTLALSRDKILKANDLISALSIRQGIK